MKIKIKKIRDAINLILDLIDQRNEGGLEIELDKDYYWFISKEALYNVENNPSDYSMGSLHDDLNEILGCLEKTDKIVSYDLVKLSSLLRFVGENS